VLAATIQHLGCEADHLSLFSAEVRNELATPPLPNHAFMASTGTTLRFTFTLYLGQTLFSFLIYEMFPRAENIKKRNPGTL